MPRLMPAAYPSLAAWTSAQSGRVDTTVRVSSVEELSTTTVRAFNPSSAAGRLSRRSSMTWALL